MLKGDSNKRTGGQRMVLSLVRHLWGVDLSRGYRKHLAGWRKIGYTAIESSPRAVPDPQELYGVLQSEGLAWIPQVFSHMFVGGGNVALHLASLREQIQECLPASPLFFNAHSGSDAWTLDEAEEFYLRVAELETEMRVTISHETHRSRYFGNPWNTMRLLERVPGVKLTCDFSHWVCVAERLLGDAAGVFTRAARNCHHLHARVGYEQGPQVSDPRAPEWKQHLLAHERWWTLVWQTRAAMGMHEITLTPEFGPFPYLQTLPYTRPAGRRSVGNLRLDAPSGKARASRPGSAASQLPHPAHCRRRPMETTDPVLTSSVPAVENHRVSGALYLVLITGVAALGGLLFRL